MSFCFATVLPPGSSYAAEVTGVHRPCKKAFGRVAHKPASIASARSMSFCTNSSVQKPVKCSRSMTEKRLRIRWQLVIAQRTVFSSTGKLSFEYLVGAFAFVHAVGNVLGLLYPGRYGLLEFIEVIEESLEFGLMVVPALQLLLDSLPSTR